MLWLSRKETGSNLLAPFPALHLFYNGVQLGLKFNFNKTHARFSIESDT